MKMMKDPRPESPAEEASESPQFEKHEIEGAADTLTRAEEIKANKPLHAHAMKHLAKKHAAVGQAMGRPPGSIQDLKSLAKKKQLEEVNDND